MTTRTATRRDRLGLARLVGALAVVLVAAAGCGDGDDATATDTGSETSSAPSESETASAEPTEEPTVKGPQCAEVWVDGAKLPGGYENCYDADQRVKMDGRYCEFGRPLVTFESRFWAVPGGPIHEVKGKLLDDAQYRDALLKCGG